MVTLETITIIVYIIFFIIIVILMAIFLSIVYSALSIAPWLPARNKDLTRINQLADLKPGQKFYELGCGDARVSLYLARHNPQAQVIGIEISLLFYLLAKLRALFSGCRNIKIVLSDALLYNLRSADVIYVFGVRRSMNQLLSKKFQQDLKNTGRVISYVFKINNWSGKVFEDKPQADSAAIYVYER